MAEFSLIVFGNFPNFSVWCWQFIGISVGYSGNYVEIHRVQHWSSSNFRSNFLNFGWNCVTHEWISAEISVTQRLTATFVLQQYKHMLIFWVLLSGVLMRCEGIEQMRLTLICPHFSHHQRIRLAVPNFGVVVGVSDVINTRPTVQCELSEISYSVSQPLCDAIVA